MRHERLKRFDARLPVHFHVSRRKASQEMYLHWHEEVEIILVLSGNLLVRNGSQTAEVGPGDLVCVHSSHLHLYDIIGENVEYYCFILSPDVIGSKELYYSPLPFITRDEKCAELCHRAARALQTKPEFYRELTRGLLLQLYVSLVELGGTQQAGDERRLTATVRAAMTYVCNHCAEELDIDRIAAAVGISRYHLCHIFKQATGQTLSHYWQLVRCDKARQMLRRGCSVSEAAEECGFSSPAYFSKVYQKHYGILPSAEKK